MGTTGKLDAGKRHPDTVAGPPGGKVHDMTTPPCCPGCGRAGERGGARSMDDALDVDVDLEVDLADGRVLDFGRAQHAGNVETDVDPAPLLLHTGKGGVPGIRRGDVQREKQEAVVGGVFGKRYRPGRRRH